VNTIKSAIYIAFGIGTLVILFPYEVRAFGLEVAPFDAGGARWLGALVGAVGAVMYFACAYDFVSKGKGTPAFWDPPRGLVLNRWFRAVRNPMYVGVALMNVGQAVFFGSTALVLYALAVTLGFHAFVVLYEEPTLRRRYGDHYRAYCRRVPRWFPRIQLPGLPE